MSSLAASLATVALAVLLVAPIAAQTPPSAGSPVPWRPRPVIIVDPNVYLGSPSPRPVGAARPGPHRRPAARPRPTAAPARRRPAVQQAPETFERLDTSPPPVTRPPRH